jgi:hypothetical protein
MARKTYRVNADSIEVLIDILITPAEDFNSDRDKIRGRSARIDNRSFFFSGNSDDEFMKGIKTARDQDRLEYVIYSYNTPIAYREYVGRAMASVYSSNGKRVGWSDYQWVINTGGSMTTSKHIHKVRAALSQISTSVKGQRF